MNWEYTTDDLPHMVKGLTREQLEEMDFDALACPDCDGGGGWDNDHVWQGWVMCERCSGWGTLGPDKAWELALFEWETVTGESFDKEEKEKK